MTKLPTTHLKLFELSLKIVDFSFQPIPLRSHESKECQILQSSCSLIQRKGTIRVAVWRPY